MQRRPGGQVPHDHGPVLAAGDRPVPSLLTATALTRVLWPARVCSTVPAARSHTITAPSQLLVTARLPLP